MRILYTCPFLSIYLHEGRRATLEMSWLGQATSEEFRAAALRSLAFSKVHHVKNWISDDRLLQTVHLRDLDWVAEVGMKPLGRMGIERFALLESLEAFNRRAIAEMYKQVTPAVNYEVRRFESLTQARAWATGTIA